MVYYMEKPSRMDNHRSKWAMFNSYVSLPEGTKKVILPTIIRVLALLSWCIFEIHEEESIRIPFWLSKLYGVEMLGFLGLHSFLLTK